MNVAIIGCGGITAFCHIPQLLTNKDSINLLYLCDTNLYRAQRIQKRYGLSNTKCISDADVVFKDENIEIVIIAVWPKNNLQLALKSIKSNKHTLIQKPLMGEECELNELLNLSNTSKLQILPLPYIEIPLLKEIIESKKLGDINYARIRTTIPGPLDYYSDVEDFFFEKDCNPYSKDFYAQYRGALSDMGPYALSLYYYLFGEGELVASFLYPKISDKIALLTLHSKAIPYCSIDIAWNQIQGLEICSIYGSDGTVCIKSDGTIETIGFNIEKASKPMQLPISPYEGQEKWLYSIKNFNGNPNFNKNIASAIWVTKIINKAYNKN